MASRTDYQSIAETSGLSNPGAAQKLEETYKKSKSASGRFIAALTIYALLGLGLSSVAFEKLKPIDFPVNTWTTWAISDFLKDDKKPDVVFLGSSLMLVPLDGVDADFTNKQIDASEHHKSLFFEDAYKKDTTQAVDSYNFALPGEMPSDAYLITDFLLKAKKAPKVLVYGVGPRDFMDNLLPSPASTDPYRYLSRFGDLNSHAPLLMPDWQERLDFELTKLFYIYGQRGQMALDMYRQVEAQLDQFFPRPDGVMSHEERVALRRKLLPTYRPMQVNKKECYFRPIKDSERPAFQDNIDEYRKRYKKLKMDTFNSQMTFLNDLIQIANSRGTHVVLVAMPITDINRQILSDKSWALYNDSLKKLAANKQVTFYDMHATGKFQLKDFQDTVHLHSGGGAKLLAEIAELMSKDPACQKALHGEVHQ